jgi:hypothetical protein
MTDNELNALVAEKVMGYKSRSNEAGTVYTTPNSYEVLAARDLPDYANNIAAAWQVALKVSSLHGYNVTIHVGDEVWIERAVETDDGNTHLVTWQDVARVGTVEGDARAICLAALEAVGVEVK